MKASGINDEYENEVEQFLEFGERNAPVISGKYFYSWNVGMGDNM